MMGPKIQILELFRQVVAQPNWYDQLDQLRDSLVGGITEAQKAKGEALDDETTKREAKKQLVTLFARLLNEHAVALAEAGPNWDADRQPIDTIIIHHTSQGQPVDLHLLNALHLLNLYVPKYQHPGSDVEEIGGLPIYSGHADVGGQQVFYAYHWLIRRDGKPERLLPDTAIGWHAGDWKVNTKSVALCFDADLENASPTQAALRSAVQVIVTHYREVETAHILGHKEIVPTICPGNRFDGWGEELRALVEAGRA